MKYIIKNLYTRNNRLKALSIILSNYCYLFKVEIIPTAIQEQKKEVIKQINAGNTKHIVISNRDLYLSDHFNGVGYYKADKDGDICIYLNGIEAINNYLKFMED